MHIVIRLMTGGERDGKRECEQMNEAVTKAQNTALAPQIEEVCVRGGTAFCLTKRVFDIAFAVVGLVVLALPMAVIAVLIRLDSPGPAIYRQERLGLDRKPFEIYKFRSMHMNAEESGPQWAERDDERTTRIGRVLRNTRLDELPQFWNILRGDMSLVGPRPEREYFYNIFEAYIPDFGKRMLVKPGLTGWAQVNGGYDLRAEEKIVYDLEYIRERSVGMDMLCILKTVKLVFTHEGAR